MHEGESQRLRRAMRDLVALSTLPTIWAGADARRIPESLAEVLRSTLDLDIVYVRVSESQERLEALRTSPSLAALPQDALAALCTALKAEPPPARVTEPGTGRTLRCAVTRFGMGEVNGVVVAATSAREFPGEEDRALLGVAANHASAELHRRNAEKRLQVKTERFELLSSNVKDYAFVITDEQGVIREWSAGAERVTHYREAEVLDLPMDILFTQADRAGGAPAAERERARREGKTAHAQWHERKGGERFYAEGVTAALRDTGGALRGFAKIFRDATEQHAAERSLRESRQFLNAVFDSAADGICVIDAQLRCSYVNPIGAALLGYEDPRDLVGQHIDAILQHGGPGTPRPSEESPVARATRDGKARRIEQDVFRRRDGTPVPVSYSVAPVLVDGERRGAVITYRDRTEAERVAREQERLLREVQAERTRLAEVFEHSPSFMAVLAGPDHVFERANRKYIALVGRGDLVGQRLCDALPEAITQGFTDLLDEVFRTGRPYVGTDVRVELRRPDGSTSAVYVDFVYQPMRGPDGEITGVFVQGVDLTERRQAQQELQALLGRETRRANLLGRVADAGRRINGVLDTETVAEVLTEQAREIIGAHQAVTSLTVSEDWAQAINATSLSDKYGAYRDYAARPDGSGIYSLVCRTNKPMRLTQEQLQAHPAWRGFGAHARAHPPMRGWLAVPLVGHGGRNLGLVQLSDKYVGEFTQEDEAVLVQLAAIASASIENARFYKELQGQARRKDEFLATLAHELRNPLAPLRNGLSLLELSTSPGQADGVREMMKRQVSHMVRLIDDLLDVSRITTGKVQLRPETVAVRSVLESALEVSRPAIERGRHELSVSISDEPSLVMRADATRMAQVVSNLLNNAAKYTPEGGRIELSAALEGQQIAIRVRDNGTGLARETISEIFELFTQVGRTIDRSQGGLGIGLALVKKLVEMHGGNVQAESPGPGKGSTFTIRLPALVAASGQAPVRHQRTLRGSRAWRILVVDDNVDAAESLSAVLAMSGHATRTCHSGPDALDAAQTFAPEIVLLDIGLPGMDGYEVARRLRNAAYGADLLLVAVTGWGSENDRKRTKEAGFDEHLTKPVDLERLEAVLAQLSPVTAG